MKYSVRTKLSPTWFTVDDRMWKDIVASGKVAETVENHTVLGDFFALHR